MDIIAYERIMDKLETIEQIGILICEKLGINLQDAQNTSNLNQQTQIPSNTITAQNQSAINLPYENNNPNPFKS